MSKGYFTQCVSFQRVGDKVFPVRIRREWLCDNTYGIVSCDSISWHDLACRSKDVPYWPYIKAETREALIAAGVIHLAGHGMPCLTIIP